MKPQKLIWAVCLLITFTGKAQNDHYTHEECSAILSDSSFCKVFVSEWVDSFKTRFDLDTAVITFNEVHLNSMYDLYASTTTVRIYFTLPTAEMDLPGAILVPVLKTDCSVDVTGAVLEAQRLQVEGYVGPMTPDLEAQMENWQTVAEQLDGLETVYGFNFTWNHIMEACNYGKDRLGIAFGISNVDFEGEGYQIHMYLTEGVNSLMNRLFLDFSSPCPRMCGNLISRE